VELSNWNFEKMEKKCGYIEDNKKCDNYEKATRFNRCMYLREDLYNHCQFIDKKKIYVKG
jgi:hypothetical protein